jgi:large subunit ribosomal protein L21
MYAIIQDSGRQYKVEEGQELDVDLRGVSTGDPITFDRVLAILGGESIAIGQPLVPGASVQAEVVGPVSGPKLVIQKFRRRKNFRRRTGHRQLHTRVKIMKIVAG